ncbi:hypothetical protein GN958_ATG12308 [Phytophthora infestans]|uniref:Uncharacterized protein n=1 Tax=Phytophthora infestans TaxID=4787 RepID=A0A8S9UD46_PHYIN|nr:hypothetical protein GN958_ATG12308 [Phytophthora infestans]
MTRNWRLSDPHAELPIKNHEYVLWINDNQIQELGGLDGCFRLKQINAQNNCIRSLEDSPQLLRYDCKADEAAASTEEVL